MVISWKHRVIDVPSTIETDGGLQCNLCSYVLGFKSTFVFLKSNILYINGYNSGDPT